MLSIVSQLWLSYSTGNTYYGYSHRGVLSFVRPRYLTCGMNSEMAVPVKCVSLTSTSISIQTVRFSCFKFSFMSFWAYSCVFSCSGHDILACEMRNLNNISLIAWIGEIVSVRRISLTDWAGCSRSPSSEENFIRVAFKWISFRWQSSTWVWSFQSCKSLEE